MPRCVSAVGPRPAGTCAKNVSIRKCRVPRRRAVFELAEAIHRETLHVQAGGLSASREEATLREDWHKGVFCLYAESCWRA